MKARRGGTISSHRISLRRTAKVIPQCFLSVLLSYRTIAQPNYALE